MVRVRPSAVFGAAVLLVLVLAIVGVRSAWAQRAAAPVPVPASSNSGQGTLDPDPASASDAAVEGIIRDEAAATQAPGGADETPEPVATAYVHVIGAVVEPGVVDVPVGARVRDVVESAGGLTRAADLTRINLARVVLDGERIWVPVAGEEPPQEVAGPVPAEGPSARNGAAPGNAADAGPDAGPDGVGTTVIDLNTADSAALQTLPGVGPVTAESILTWRTEHGAFTTVEELMEVSGIGPRTLEKVKPLVVVGP